MRSKSQTAGRASRWHGDENDVTDEHVDDDKMIMLIDVDKTITRDGPNPKRKLDEEQSR